MSENLVNKITFTNIVYNIEKFRYNQLDRTTIKYFRKLDIVSFSSILLSFKMLFLI